MKFTIDTKNKTIEIADAIKINELLEQLNKMDVDYKEYTIVPVGASINLGYPIYVYPVDPCTNLKNRIWYTTNTSLEDKNNTVE